MERGRGKGDFGRKCPMTNVIKGRNWIESARKIRASRIGRQRFIPLQGRSQGVATFMSDKAQNI